MVKAFENPLKIALERSKEIEMIKKWMNQLKEQLVFGHFGNLGLNKFE